MLAVPSFGTYPVEEAVQPAIQIHPLLQRESSPGAAILLFELHESPEFSPKFDGFRSR